MQARFLLLLASMFALPALGGACVGPAPAPTTQPKVDTAIVVGVTSDLRANVDFDRLHVVVHASSTVVADRVLEGASLKLPLEIRADDLSAGEDVDVDVQVFLGSFPEAIVERTARTKAIAGKTLLLRAFIDSRCVDLPGSSAPSCTTPETCIAGVCQDDSVDPQKLPPYTTDWAVTGDICKPKNHGAPEIIVGEGQADYLPMKDMDVAQVEAGPQGGHHVWVAIRQKNIKQSGTVTTVTGRIPDLDVDIEPFSVVFTFDQDEGGYCKLYGLRFQLDQTHDINTLLGHVLEIHVEADDADGDKGTGDRTVVLSNDFLGP